MPRGWPKGKPRGPRSPEQIGKATAALQRGRRRKEKRIAAMAFGRAPLHQLPRKEGSPQSRFNIFTSQAIWLPIQYHVGEYEYVNGELDEIYMRALESRVVYASSADCHHEPPFQDVTIEVIAAAERQARKDRRPPRPQGLLRPLKGVVPMPKRDLFTQRRLEIIGLIAAGLTFEEIGAALKIAPRTVKMHADVLRSTLHVEHAREIPLAFYKKTGKNVFSLIDTIDMPTVASDKTHTEGRPLLEVVEAMFREPTT